MYQYAPLGCYLHDSNPGRWAHLHFNDGVEQATGEYGNTGSCTTRDQCLCVTPTRRPTAAGETWAPTVPPTASPAGQLRVVTTGSCSDPIRTIAECSAAAAALGLSDVTAQFDEHGVSVSYAPVGCYFDSGSLKFNDRGNPGSCTTYQQCLCGRPATRNPTATGETWAPTAAVACSRVRLSGEDPDGALPARPSP